MVFRSRKHLSVPVCSGEKDVCTVVAPPDYSTWTLLIVLGRKMSFSHFLSACYHLHVLTYSGILIAHKEHQRMFLGASNEAGPVSAYIAAHLPGQVCALLKAHCSNGEKNRQRSWGSSFIH